MKLLLRIAVCLLLLVGSALAEISGRAGVKNFTGGISMTGNRGNGSDAVNNVNVNSVINPATYGAVSSTLEPTCTGSSGSGAVTCSGTGDFVTGQPITLNHAGATPTVLAPSAITVTGSKWNGSANADVADGTGATNATYLLGSADGLGGIVMAASATSIANSQATLSFTAFNKPAWTTATGATATVVCGCVGAACTPTLIGIVPANQAFFYDMGTGTGLHFGTASDGVNNVCVAGAVFNDNLNTTVASAASGLPTALTASLAQNVTSQFLFHDNSVPINSAISAICASGGTIQWPSGNYAFGQGILLNSCKGVKFNGVDKGFQGGSTFYWYGGLGGIPFENRCSRDSTYQGFNINKTNGNTPAIALLLSQPASGCTNAATNISVRDLYLDESGYGVYVSGNANNCPLHFYNVSVANGGIANWVINNGQSKNNDFYGVGEARRLYGFYCINCGNESFVGTQGNGWIEAWLNQNIVYVNVGGEDEVSSRILITSGPTGATGSASYYGSQLQIGAANFPADGIAFSMSWHGSIILNGVNFMGGGSALNNFGIYTNNSSYGGVVTVESTGNNYPGNAPFQYVANGNAYMSQGDTYFTGAASSPLPTVLGVGFQGMAKATIAGGGSLATGSNSILGTVTASAATGNVVTPGITCAHNVVCILSDETTGGGAKVTASTATNCTYSATAADVVDFMAGCR